MHAVDVLTYHNNVARTALNANETQLTPANLNTIRVIPREPGARKRAAAPRSTVGCKKTD